MNTDLEYPFLVRRKSTKSLVLLVYDFVDLRFLVNLDGLKHVRVNICVWILVSSTKNERFSNKNLQLRVKWFISDSVPKKSKKFKFWIKFPTMFFSIRNWLEKSNFDNFFCRFFRKAVKKFQISEYVNYLTKRFFSKVSKNA